MAATQIVISAVDRTKPAFDSVQASLGAMSSKVAAALSGIAAGFGAISLKGKFDDIIAGAAKLDDLAEITGASVENLSKLGTVAKIAGIDLGEVATAMTKMAKGLAGLGGEEGTEKGAPAALKALGLSAKDAAGNLRDPAELMVDIAGKLGQYRDGMEKTQLAQALFGRGGAQLLPFLKDLHESGSLVAKVTAEQAAQAEQYEKMQKRLTIATEAWQKQIAFEAMPAAQALVEVFLKMQTEAGGLKDKVDGLKNDGSLKDFAREGALAIASLIDTVRYGVGSMTALGGTLSVIGSGAELFAARVEKARVYARTSIDTNASRKNFARSAADRGESRALADLDENRMMLGRAITDMMAMSTVREKLEAKFAEMDARAKLTGGKPSPRAPGVPIAKKADGSADAEMRKYISALQQEEEKLAALTGQSELENMQLRLTKGSLKDLTKAHKDEIEAIAKKISIKKEEIRAGEMFAKHTAEMEVIYERANEAKSKFFSASAKQEQDLAFQATLIGKTTFEVEKLTRAREVSLRANEATSIEGADVAGIDAMAKKTIALQDEMLDKNRELGRSWRIGMKTSLQSYIDDVGNAAKQTEALMSNAFRGMEDAFVKFAQTGKLDFKALSDSIITDLIRIQVRQSITGPLAAELGKAGKGEGILGDAANWFKGVVFGADKAGKSLDALADESGNAVIQMAIDIGKQSQKTIAQEAEIVSMYQLTAAANSAASALAGVGGGSLASSGGGSLSGIGDMFSGGGWGDAVGSAGGIDGWFADGGRPRTGRISMVGERGPELFVPDSAGTIIPNEAIGGNTITVNQVINPAQGNNRNDMVMIMAAAKDAAVREIAGKFAMRGFKDLSGALA